MTARLPGVLLVPYGVDSWQPDAIRLAHQSLAGLDIEAPFPCEVLDLHAARPLRFNSASYHFDGMPDMTDSGGDEWTYLRDLLKRLCRPWDRTAALLVDRYFETIEALVAENATALNEKIAPFAGLFERRHWLFSAPKPLPRAHVLAPAASPAKGFAAEDFLPVDFAFFTGGELVVINSQQTSLTPRKARERTERLAATGLKALTVSPADLEGDNARKFFIEALTPLLPAFWSDEPLPAGPFRSAGLAA